MFSAFYVGAFITLGYTSWWLGAPIGFAEPPRPFGCNYGRLTPLTTVLGQTLFGLVLGIAFSNSSLSGTGA